MDTDMAPPVKWIMGIVASLIVLAVSFLGSTLYGQMADLRHEQAELARLVAEHSQQHAHATNVIRRLYEQREALLTDVAALKERVGKLEAHAAPLGR